MRCLRIKTRQDWGAQPALFEEPYLKGPVTKLFLWYHTPDYHWKTNNPDQCLRIMREMQRRHMEDLGFADIAYHYVIGGDGFIYEGRDLSKNTPKELKNNPIFYGNRIDIAYMGDFLFSDPPTKQLEVAFQTANICVKKGKLHKLYTYTIIREPLVLPEEREALMEGRFFNKIVKFKVTPSKFKYGVSHYEKGEKKVQQSKCD